MFRYFSVRYGWSNEPSWHVFDRRIGHIVFIGTLDKCKTYANDANAPASAW